MKNKLVLLLTASVLSALMLGACGSATKTSDQSSSATTSVAKKADKTAQKPVQQTTNAAKTTAASNVAAGNVVDIKIEATDFQYDKKVIHVKKGDKVRITLHSDDGGHGFTIPAFNVDIKGNKSVEFVADKTGTFEYHCSLFCGSGHAKMTGKLIVE